MTKNDRAVMALSVYNALSLSGRDMTTMEVVTMLAKLWDKSASRNAARVSEPTIAAAAQYLEARTFIRRDGDVLRIDARDPRTRRGATLNIDYTTGSLVRC